MTESTTGQESEDPQIIPEWLTSFLDGEAVGEEKEKAKKALSGSGQMKKEAEDLQKAWDLLDLLPKVETEASKSRATMDLVLSHSGAGLASGSGMASEPRLASGSGFAFREDERDTSGLDQRTEHPVLSLKEVPASRYKNFLRILNRIIPLCCMGLAGGLMGGLLLLGWHTVEEKRFKKVEAVQGVVENVQILRDLGDLEFLKGISQSELFGQQENGASP